MNSNLNISPNSTVFIPENALNQNQITNEQEALSRATHLAIGAHQDDLEIFAYHGIEQCYQQSNKWFVGITVTDGSGSSRENQYSQYSDAEMKQVRLAEQNKAAFIGEYSIQYQLGYPSTALKTKSNTAVTQDLLQILRHTPNLEVLYLHNLFDKHDTHVGVTLKCLQALKQIPIKKHPTKIYGCEVWRDLDWFNDSEKITLSTSNRENLANALLGVFDSQISGGKRYDKATQGRRYANATFGSSHSTDKTDSVTYAIDLKPLLNSSISLSQFITDKIENFKSDALNKINRFSL